MAIIANLQADQGSSFACIIDVKDSNGRPLDVRGSSFRAQFRKSYNSVVAVDFSCDVLNPIEGQVAIILTSDTVRCVKPGRYVYDVEMFDTAGNVSRILEGQIEFTPAVTTPDSSPSISSLPSPYRLSGSGSPENRISAPVGYSYIDTDSGTLYFKMSGASGSTGWTAFVQIQFTPAVTTPPPPPTPYRLSGSGSPENRISAPVGYSYIDTDSVTLYFKMSGSNGPTGWAAFVQL